MKKSKLNLLVTANTGDVNYLQYAKKILQWVNISVLAIIVLSTTVFYVIANLNLRQIKQMENEIESNAAEFETVNALIDENSTFKSEMDWLGKHSTSQAETATLTLDLIAQLVDTAYPVITISRYEYVVDARTGIHSLALQGNANNTGDPLAFVNALQEKYADAMDIKLSSISSSSRNEVVNFNVSCVMRGIENEN